MEVRIAEIIPISLREANRFIEKHHRHSGRAQGCKFCVALSDGHGTLHGVAVVGRPISRYLDDGRTAEVTRLCTDGILNGCSFLYGCCARIARDGVSEDHHLHAGGGKRGQPAGLRVVVRTGIPGRWKLECAGAPTGGEPEHRPKTNVLQGIEVKQVVFDLTMLWNALWPGSVLFTGRTSPAAPSASTKAVLTVTNRGKAKKNSMNAILFDMAAKAAPLVRMDAYKRRKLEAQLKSAEIQMSPETYVAAAWVKGGLIGLLVIPALLIFPILAPVVLFLAVAVFFKEQKRADEIVQQRREEIETELPRFVNTVEQELRSSRDVLNILKAYQHNAGHAMKRELEITIADMASGNEENALTRWESRIRKHHALRCGARADFRQARRQRHYLFSNALHDLQTA